MSNILRFGDIKGLVQININNNSSKLQHQEIKIELIGKIDIHINEENNLNNNNKNQFNGFLSLTNNLSISGILNRENNNYDFEFKSVE